jgi:hypothetical protein
MADDFVFISDEARKQIRDQHIPLNHAMVDLLRNTNAATKNPRSAQESLQKAVLEALSALKHLLSIVKKLTPFETALSILDTIQTAIDAQKPEDAVLVSPNIAAATYNSGFDLFYSLVLKDLFQFFFFFFFFLDLMFHFFSFFFSIFKFQFDIISFLKYSLFYFI